MAQGYWQGTPTATWAGRPAVGAAGAKFFCSDIGINGGSRWVSNGTYWLPDGQIVLGSWGGGTLTGIASLTGNGAVQKFIVAPALTIPIGLLVPGIIVEMSASINKFGTHTGNMTVGISEADDAAATAQLGSQASAAGNDSITRVSGTAKIGSAGFIGATNNATNQMSSGTAGTVAVARTVGAPYPNTAVLYPFFGISAGYSDSSAVLLQAEIVLR